MSLDALFEPRGIAILGASKDPARIGAHPLNALIGAGYRGGIYPVNPRHQEISGLRCYGSVAAIDGPCDLAVVALPAAAVPEAIRACGAAGIRGAVVLSSGFREAGGAGLALEEQLALAARESGVRVIGPNCMGLLSVPSRVWAVFASISQETGLREGRVSAAFQSGGFGYAIVNLAEAQGIGFRRCVSTGNETDVAMPELVSHFLADQGTDAVFAMLEGTSDARAFLDIGSTSLSLGKPVLIWKCGTSAVGARAAASHTANLTGRADLYRATFRQAGLIEVEDVEPMIDIARLVAHRRLPAGPNVGVLSISGGSGIVFADRAAERGLHLPQFSARTLDRLREILPAFGSAENPADVTAAAFNDIGLMTRTISIVLEDPGVDQLAVLLASIPGATALRSAEAIVRAAAQTEKPVAVAWSGRRSRAEEAYALLEAAAIPIVPTPVRLAEAMGRLGAFAAHRRRHLAAPPEGRSMGAGLPAVVLPDAGGPLSEIESKRLLEAYGVPATREVLVPADGDPVAAARALRPPFAVKIVSPDIPHKTEAGGVLLGVGGGEGLRDAASKVVANARTFRAGARIEGVLVAEMAAGVEMLVGVVNDPAFGAAVAVGVGGVLAEVMGDVTHRIAPFDEAEADRMIGELKGAALLDGVRGAPRADRAALAALLARVSQIAVAMGERLVEMDINPVLVRPLGEGVVAADALIVLAAPRPGGKVGA